MAAKYYLYRNLHTNTFSIKYKGKVISHPKICKMQNTAFNVSEKGRKRVLKEKRKNVHATISAECWLPTSEHDLQFYNEIFYDPYKMSTFIDHLGNPIYNADEVLCQYNKIYIKK